MTNLEYYPQVLANMMRDKIAGEGANISDAQKLTGISAASLNAWSRGFTRRLRKKTFITAATYLGLTEKALCAQLENITGTQVAIYSKSKEDKPIVREDKPKPITPERQHQLTYGECITYRIDDIPNRLKELESRGHTII